MCGNVSVRLTPSLHVWAAADYDGSQQHSKGEECWKGSQM
jgi:hypothetical protein